jgi:arylsulfatase A-like enzyme
MKEKVSRRKAIRYIAATGAFTTAALSPFRLTGGAAAGRPNIIFILIDDQRWDAMGCAGHPFFKSPNMDRVAREGVLFSNAFVTTSLCAPSRSSFLTGRYAGCTGVTNNLYQKGRLPGTFLEYLHAAGYDTAFIGKWHIDPIRVPDPRGVDHLVTFKNQGFYYDCPIYVHGEKINEERYITDALTEYALEFLARPRSKPFCLYLSHKAVHSPMKPPASYEGLYRDAEVKLPPEYLKEPEHKYNLMHTAVMGMEEPEDIVKIIRSYYETLAAVDESLGSILEFLDDKGLADNTIVVYAGDNGFFWGEHGLVDKRYAYEESIRIPFLARWPEGLKNPGRKIEDMVLNIDLAPTLLDVAGAPVPPSMQGRSFKPLLSGKDISTRDSFLYQYFLDSPWPVPPIRAVRTADWKYIHYRFSKMQDELFHLKEDPRERNNLVNDPAAYQMKQRLNKELKRLEKEVKTC